VADPKAPERWWFCPDCGLRDAHRHDVGGHDDCSECGMDCWRESQLREMLFKAGRHIVSEVEKRVLDCMAEIEIEVLEYIRDKQSCAPPIFHPPCLAELARRSRT
jgi:hypothetical protein